MAAAIPSGATRPVHKALNSDFVRHSALVFGATMASNALNYLFNFALSRRLGVEGFATLSSLVGFVMIVSIPASILTLVVVKYTATFHAASDSVQVGRLSKVLLKWTSIAAVGAFIIGFSLHGNIADFLRIPDDAAIPLCIGIFALSFVTPSVRAILQGEQDFLRYSISSVLEICFKVVAAVVLVYAGFGVAGAMAGWMLGTFTALGYTIWAVLQKHGARGDGNVRLVFDLRRLWHTMLGVGLSSAFLIMLSFMDVLLVKHYFEPHEAGLYAAVNLTGKVVLFVASFVPAVLLPKTVAISARGENAKGLLLNAGGLTIVMSGVVLILFGAMPHLVVRFLAGRDFISAAPYVLQYDAAMCLLAILTLVVNYRIGIHSFGFLPGLGTLLVCEVVAIAFFHYSLWDVIHILLLGNAVAVAVCCLGLNWTSAVIVTERAQADA